MKDLTPRQKKVLGFITEHIENHAYPPTIREIGDHFSISVKGAYDHVDAIRKKGFLRFGGKRSRTMEVIKGDKDDSRTPDSPVLEVPLLGTVAAGKPILTEENWDGSVPVPMALLKRNVQYFAMTVRGDSMIGAGIMDGDVAVIAKQEFAADREIVLAQVDDGLTLKRFFKEANRVRLEPENSTYKPIYTQDVRILGRLAQIIRSY